MGDQHRLYGQLREQLEHLGQREPLPFQVDKGVGHAAGLRARALLAEVFAPPADTVHALGDVDELEPGRKSPDQVARLRGRTAPHPG